jgi:ADP-heptose:LPS heptosyltransferase
LKQARALVSGDTGPMHFAAGLGVPLVALFGPTSLVRWSPLGQKQQIISAGPCYCDSASHICQSAQHCLNSIGPEQVFTALKNVLASA